MGCTISEGAGSLSSSKREAADAACVGAGKGHRSLLRFSIASIHVERPSAGNDQKKMVVPRYGAPQSVCFPEIAHGLDLSTVRSPWSHARKKGVHVSAARPH